MQGAKVESELHAIQGSRSLSPITSEPTGPPGKVSLFGTWIATVRHPHYLKLGE